MTPKPSDWVQLCPAADIGDGASQGFDVGDQHIFVVRQGTRVRVYRNRCPHRGLPLNWKEHQFLDPTGTMIQCAQHGALFIIDSGRCVTGPCPGATLEAIPHQIINNHLWIAES